MSRTNELDKTLHLEGVYYSAPVPRSLQSLVALGFVFDRIHFPGVCLPRGDYDRKAWRAEADRIEDLGFKDPDTKLLVAAMRLSSYADVLDGFCSFGRGRDDSLDNDKAPMELVSELHEAMWGKPHPGTHPVFSSWHHKGVPDSKEHLTYPGDYYYQAGALLASSKNGLPLINDVAGLPIPGITPNQASDAKALSAFLAMEMLKIAVPDLPLLTLEDLVEFREENSTNLRAFRRTMLRYAGEWRNKLADLPADDLARETAFLIETEIVPSLDELRETVSSPARPWYKRAIGGVRIIPSLAVKCFTMSPAAAAAQVLLAYAPQLFDDLAAKGDKKETLKRSGLYYLLQIQTKAGQRA